MRAFLSIFVERFGKYSSSRLNILNLSSLRDIDACTKIFCDAKEMRKSLINEIDEFKRLYETEINKWKKEHPGEENNGKIYANYIVNVGKDSFLATVPVLYENDELVSLNEALDHIAYYLEDDKNFKELYDYKKYLLKESKDGKEYKDANDYFTKSRDIKIKRAVIHSLIDRIKNMDDEKRYLYLRSLTNLCRLTKHEIYSDAGKIGMLSSKIPIGDVVLDSKPTNYQEYFYFDKLIDEENDEELYNLYGLEEIEKMKEGKKHV